MAGAPCGDEEVEAAGGGAWGLAPNVVVGRAVLAIGIVETPTPFPFAFVVGSAPLFGCATGLLHCPR